MGDFNEVVNQLEKFMGTPISRSRSNLFVATLDRCNLIDLGFNDPKFTRTNKRKLHPILERLDRGWANTEWL